jgi:hypothetical protein
MANGEVVNRDWLILSESAGKVYCYPCMLFRAGPNELSNQFKIGFDDGKMHMQS